MKLPLLALNGAEPLAFLAALGTLRGTATRWPSARLSWTGEAPFQPLLELPDGVTEEAVIENLVLVLHATEKLEFFTRFGSEVKVSPGEYRKLFDDLAGKEDEDSLAALEYLYALGNEMVPDRSGKKLKPTAWHMTAGQQQFLEMAGILLRETTAEHLRAALLKPWEYVDPPPSMRWDTSGERLYALEARNPSSVQIRTVRGANALGFLALPFFPVSVVNGRLQTRGFIRTHERRDFLVWPIWRPGLTSQVIPLLLGDSRLAQSPTIPTSLIVSGVAAVYRSERSINDHGYGTLRPSEQIL
ncbi:MAG: hypothetical protein WDN28_02105 [Chthoniobacter sp.]